MIEQAAQLLALRRRQVDASHALVQVGMLDQLRIVWAEGSNSLDNSSGGHGDPPYWIGNRWTTGAPKAPLLTPYRARSDTRRTRTLLGR